MKFLRNTATDLFARNARFINFSPESPHAGVEGDITDKESAEKYLYKDTQERLDALNASVNYSAHSLKAANTANKAVDSKLPSFYEKLKALQNPTDEQLKLLARDYLVDKSLTGETAKMYRTEMFASFRAKLEADPLGWASNEDISNLLLNGMSEVFTYPKTQQSVHSSLWSASRMMKYDADSSGVNVKDWTAGGSIMRFESRMKRSNETATVDAAGNLMIGGNAYDISGCEILTGSGMADYPPKYLSKFEFRNLIVDPTDPTRVMACVNNGCKGNLAVFKLGTPVVSTKPSTGGGQRTPGKTPSTVPGGGGTPEITPDVTPGTSEECKECQEVPKLMKPEDCNCLELTGEQILKGLNGSPEEKKVLLEQQSELAVSDIKLAREAYLKLYGRTEWDKTGETIKENGIFVDVEDYYNQLMKLPVVDMAQELFGTDKLEKTLEEKEYGADTIARFTGKISEARAEYSKIEKSVSAQFGPAIDLGDRNAGATKDFLLRLAVGAIFAGAMAVAVGVPLTAPLLLVGLPLLKIRGKIKSFSRYPNSEEVYATLTASGATQSDMTRYAAKGDVAEGKELGHAALHNRALASADTAKHIINQSVASLAAFKIGLDPPDLDKAVKDGILTEEERKEYEALDANILNAKEKANSILPELALSAHVIEMGAGKEADDARNGGDFRLTRRRKGKFDDIMDSIPRTHIVKQKNQKYTRAVQLLLDNFNEKAPKLLGKDLYWGKEEKLTMESLDAPFNGYKEFRLGILSQKRSTRNNDENVEHELYVKLNPEDDTWEMYLKEYNPDTKTWDKLDITEYEYGAAKALIKKKSSKFTLEDIQELLYDPEGFDQKEQNDIVSKLETFDIMMAYVDQLNEAKDLMSKTVEYQGAKSELATVRNRFKIEANSDGTAEEVTKYKYKVALGSTLDQFTSFADFNEKLGHYFQLTSVQKGLLEDVYASETSQSMNALVANKDFVRQTREVSCAMDDVKTFASISGVSALYNCLRNKSYYSGRVAGKNSKYHTVNVGHALLATQLVATVVPREVTDVVTEVYKYTTGGKTAGGEAIVLDISVQKEIIKKIPLWKEAGYLNSVEAKQMLIPLGSTIASMVMDASANQPEKTPANTKAWRIAGKDRKESSENQTD